MQTDQTYRGHAIAAGIFFIIATAFLFVGESFYKPALTAPDVLATAAGDAARVRFGILIEFTCVLAIPLVAIALYPVLRRVSAALAIGYVAFRLFEAAIFTGMEIDRMFVLALSQSYAANPGADLETLTLMVEAMIGGDPWSGVSGPLYNLVFVTGMLMVNWMFWTSRLLPRWISGWGMVMAVVMGGLAVSAQFTEINSTLAIALIAPLAVQEMVMAVWFIVKGFNRAALGRLAPG
jgi:hypothetical protein